MTFLIDAFVSPIFVAETANMSWDCLHLKFMGAIHGKHINRIKLPHTVTAFNKGYSSILFSVCTDANGFF